MADPDRVFDLYFSKAAPFGEGKKKAEFPDAFVLSTLSAWGEKEEQTILIASDDGDFKNGVDHFPSLKHAGRLEQLLAFVAEEADQFATAADAALNTLQGRIEEQLLDRFEGLGFFVADQDGDVAEVRPTTVSYQANLLYVEDTGDGVGEAAFAVVGTIVYEADLSYDDMDSAIYDHEEHQYLVFGTIEESVTREEVFQAELLITFPLDGQGQRDVEVTWNSPSNVSVASSASDHD